MKQKLLIRSLVSGAIFAASLVFSPAQAQDYNEGLLAAEAGDYNTAVTKWQPLATQGDAMAQFNMALMYHRGLGVNIDESKAVAWYKKSANNGYLRAQEYLAVAYQEGWFGLAKDKEKADYWLNRIEEQSF